MKRIVFILSLVLMFANANSVGAATTQKAEIKAVKNVLKSQIESANKYSFSDFVKHFDLQYVTSDGFNVDVYSKLVEETWAVYPNIQYAHTIKNVTVMDNDAIAEVIETANAQVQSQYDLKGSLRSVANNIYFLRKTPDGWRIVSDVILTENTYLAFGELVNHMPTLTTPYQTLANRSYTATLEYVVPKDAIAIASLNQERVSYPQESMKENYRKLPEDGVLERFFTANGDSTNEYVVASLGLTRPKFEDKDLQIGITGIAYIIKRVNVVPENKFINMTDVIPVKERLAKYAIPVKEEVVDAKEVKAETVNVDEKTEDVKSQEQEQVIEEKTSPVVEQEITPVTEVDTVPATEERETIEVKQEETPVVEKAEEQKADSIDVPVSLTKEEKDAVKRVVDEQKAIEKATEQQAKQDAKDKKQEEKVLLKEQKANLKLEKRAELERVKAEKRLAKQEAANKKLEGKYQDKIDKLEKNALAKEQKAAEKAEKAKQKSEKLAEQEKARQEKKAAKLEQKVEKNKQKQREEQEKREVKKEKKLDKGAFSPETVGIPVSATVCPIETVEVANDQSK